MWKCGTSFDLRQSSVCKSKEVLLLRARVAELEAIVKGYTENPTQPGDCVG